MIVINLQNNLSAAKRQNIFHIEDLSQLFDVSYSGSMRLC